ncbi:hypothetical protein [Atlantibacter sp.]|uniref:hypothetical protein n=1 Tax=Atlantibacter sp. TaxID=1903473 RepID=UPI0028AF0895|nr:hypothetical protein [Atlantibacter sp.]
MIFKKKIVLVYIAFFLGLLVVASHIIPIRPVVVIANNTDEYIFVYAGESIYNIEPEPEEVERIVRLKPKIIASGKKIKITSSFMSLIKKDVAIDIGWRVGGQYGYNSIGGGGQNFILSSIEGVCSVSIEIKDSSSTNIIKNNPGGLCLKKLKEFKYEY